jgi:hypothetical protein
MSTGRENGLNKAYLYGKQAQVQYINLEWTNEIGKKMWHKAYTVVPPVKNNEGRTLSWPCKLFPYKLTIYIQ